MVYYFKSTGIFLVRWLKYAWPVLLFGLLDAVDLWKSYIEPSLPPSWQGLTVPTPLAIIGFVLVSFWAAAHVFHQVRKDRDDKADKLEVKVSQDALSKASGLYKDVVNDIWNADINSDQQYKNWEEKWQEWQSRVVDLLDEEFPEGTAQLFDTVGFLDTPPVAGGYNEEHNETLRVVMWKIKKLRQIIDEYSRVTA